MKSSLKFFFAISVLAATIPAAQAATIIVPPSEWGAMQTVAGANPHQELIYEFTVTPDQPLTISTSFTASSYAPNAYEAGFVSPGWFGVRSICTTCGTEGNVIWEMRKPYESDFRTAYTRILIGGAGRGDEVADYVPGGSYQSTLVWNRATGKIDINVTGPGLDVTRQVDSNGYTITGLVFHGPDLAEMAPSAFGNVSVTTQAVPVPAAGWLLGSAVLGLFGLRRRVR
ncbi:MAG: VPLPA-CTERM sorting domain-containing protein [Candidatus Methylumidiphilus sp.]